MLKAVTADMFREQYADVFRGDERWRKLAVPEGSRFAWDPGFHLHPQADVPRRHDDGAGRSGYHGRHACSRCSATASRRITSRRPDRSRPTVRRGSILIEKGVKPADFNSYGARRGNHEVMMRGTFANVRLRNQMAPGTEGGWTRYQPSGEQMTIYDASVKYQQAGVPLLVIAGKEYGSGSSRDWAAKGTFLLGVKAVIAESFERIHRSNLVNMGVLPLQFKTGRTAASLKLTGTEEFTLRVECRTG